MMTARSPVARAVRARSLVHSHRAECACLAPHLGRPAIRLERWSASTTRRFSAAMGSLAGCAHRAPPEEDRSESMVAAITNVRDLDDRAHVRRAPGGSRTHYHRFRG